MPLPRPVPRRLVHTRKIKCNGFLRTDGLWDIEGTFIDVKADNYFEGDSTLPAGIPLHGMSLRLTCDRNATIVAAISSMDHTPYPECRNVNHLTEKLAGLTIEKGFMTEARRRIGGCKGCTHIMELLLEVGSTAFQTMYEVRKAEREEQERIDGRKQRPPLLDSCYAFRSESPVVRRKWPDFATSTNPEGPAEPKET